MISGVTIILYDDVEMGKDEFGEPIYQSKEIMISNVLIVPTSTDDVTNTVNLTGRKAVYTLSIPKDDKHNWENKKVRFFEKDWRVIGITTEGIEKLIPLSWNKKAVVERYE